MKLVVNGLEREVPDGSTVASLLKLEREPVKHVLVEINGVYLPAGQYDRTLQEGDRVEIILPAFGG